ncbi:MAG: S8 family serine peptidase [Bacteroidota bacterium]|nr:S8 family serine peptidase [Bacteroidota bacterium]
MLKNYTQYLNLFFLFILILITGKLFSQAQFSTSSKRFLFEIERTLNNKSNKTTNVSHNIIDEYGLYSKNGTYYVGAMLLVQPKKFNSNDLKQYKISNFHKIGDVVTVRVPIQNFRELINCKGLLLIDIGDPLSPFLNQSIINTRTDSVHWGLGGLDRPYTGKGVIIAVIDWGFDYTHPIFYDSTLTRNRIVRAWDQNKLSGPSPSEYGFGTEYKSFEELQNAKSDTMYHFGNISHGTHVGGIAGGAGAGKKYMGIAPESSLIFISLRRDATSLLDAFSYIKDYAESVKMPFVVNMSFGSHLGPHDGSSLENRGIDSMSGPGRIFVGSAGNNGDANFHLKHDFPKNGDTLKTIVNFTSVPEYFGQTLSMWGSKNSNFAVRFKLIGPNNLIIHTSSFYNSKDELVLTDVSTFNSNDSLIIRITATKSFVTNGKPNIRAEVRNTSNYRVLLEAISDSCLLHIWNNVRLTRRYTNWGVALSSAFPKASAGNTMYGLGEPSGVGKSVITVASHLSDRFLPNGSIQVGNLSGFSSRGPTVDERRKPDISGPGQNVISSVSSFDPSNTTPDDNVVFEGKTYPFMSYSGTSMSGPTVAGIVALLLELNPTLSQTQIKEILKLSRRLDSRTGIIGDTGSLSWGAGKVNALNAMLLAKNYPFLTDFPNSEIIVFPNPSQKEIKIWANDYSECQIFDITGKNCGTFKLLSQTTNVINISHFFNGLYFIKFTNNYKTEVKRFIKY